jgi:hypothetical protein
LKQALDRHRFDAAFGGARRDEEKSRAKERIFSLRSAEHGWNPKNQRPELWRLYNTRLRQGESMRVFPLSNWTELDVGEYIAIEEIPIVPLYFAKRRPVVSRDGVLIMVDDDRLPLAPGEQPGRGITPMTKRRYSPPRSKPRSIRRRTPPALPCRKHRVMRPPRGSRPAWPMNPLRPGIPVMPRLTTLAARTPTVLIWAAPAFRPSICRPSSPKMSPRQRR